MTQYYKPLADINTADIVRFKTIGFAEDGKYGKHHQCIVDVNGQEMKWTLSSDKYNQLKEAGFDIGDTVKVQKWAEGVKKGYNFKSPSAANPYKQPPAVPSVMMKNDPLDVPGEYVDPFQIKVSRGASLNLASQYVLYKTCGGLLSVEDWMDDIEKYATKIQPRQMKYVN